MEQANEVTISNSSARMITVLGFSFTAVPASPTMKTETPFFSSIMSLHGSDPSPGSVPELEARPCGHGSASVPLALTKGQVSWYRLVIDDVTVGCEAERIADNCTYGLCATCCTHCRQAAPEIRPPLGLH